MRIDLVGRNLCQYDLKEFLDELNELPFAMRNRKLKVFFYADDMILLS